MTANLKPKVSCPCGCGAFGMPRKKAWGDGLRHVRRCPCRRCVGSRHRGKANRRENRIAADLGGTREPLSGGLSGADVVAHDWSFEETSNETVVRGFRRWWTSKTVQRKLMRLMMRAGAHGLVLSWDGRPQVVISPYEDFVGQFPAQTGVHRDQVRVLPPATYTRSGRTGLPEAAGDDDISGRQGTGPPLGSGPVDDGQGRGQHGPPGQDPARPSRPA